MYNNETFQGSTTAPSPYPTAIDAPHAPNVAVPYRPMAGRADRLDANIPGMVGAIGNIATRFTGGLGGSNQ